MSNPGKTLAMDLVDARHALERAEAEFDAALDRWANRDLFDKEDGYWKPLFTVV